MISALVGIFLGLCSNIIANWLQPHLEKKRRLFVGLFVSLVATSLLLATNFPSCKRTSSPATAKISSDKTGKEILVFCDLSGSQDSTAIKLVIKTSKEIIQSCSYSDIYFFSTSYNLYTSELLHIKPRLSSSLDEMAKEKRYMEEVQQIIMEKYRSLKGHVEPTCILNSLNIAYNKFKQDNIENNNELYLVFISDMMESCDKGSTKIDLYNKSRFPISPNCADINKDNLDLVKLGVNIVVVMTVSNDLPIEEGLHRKFWNQAFQCYGYSDSAAKSIVFSSSLPKYIQDIK